ncbi:hypothetical protein AB6F64_08175 [Providencia hangzhouensis]|uniref:hypothetical protein n=1 Tax=Providencia TaxID=586 RepID=UPI00234959BB|nr:MULTISPECIES: hypothetical protein [unclassified Providencia]
MSKLIATYKVRSLKDGECFYCHNGCGECKTVEVNENNVVVNGDVIEYTKMDVSSCCHSKVGIWDDKNDCGTTEPVYILTKME